MSELMSKCCKAYLVMQYKVLKDGHSLGKGYKACSNCHKPNLPFIHKVSSKRKEEEMNKRKCKCKRFREAVNKNYEIKKAVWPSGTITYSLCVVEGIESLIAYCPWCGGELCQ